MKIIRSVRDAKGNTFQKQPAGGTGRIRCPKCSMIATPQLLPGGKSVMQCGSCGANYTMTGLDRPKEPTPGVVPRRVASPTQRAR